MSDIEALERAIDMAVLALTREGNSDVAITLNNHITEYKRQVHVSKDKLRHKNTRQSSLDEGLRLHHNAIEVDLAMEVKNDGQ